MYTYLHATGNVLEKGDAEVLPYGCNELVATAELRAAVLQEDLQQLQGENLAPVGGMDGRGKGQEGSVGHAWLNLKQEQDALGRALSHLPRQTL